MDLNDVMKMLKDPQALQKQALEAQARMASLSAVGSAGGGMVKMTLNGAMDLLSVEIAPEAIDPNDPAMLQDLIKAAHNDAAYRVKEAMQADVARSMGSIPGFNA
ncbi:MAG: YbaB/EbfC family nucleoid-associated protein [Spirochaetes bacterium]|nr:YbaB/EbfC family nucleoid-associated protein [Spirochaetota bacterium]MBU1079368.1 YbaB/EbfC family nucleoid-associated protein [Spirochaetota bacterium]